ncbi:hypothetical protein PVOR_11845 [Paenibacillus vortex V453]|uniref:Secreted protein n=2 Tax=Paenibacillus TaxID=44249 RepID=A0A162EMN2_9BACL|nr:MULTISPECIES: hypothetical protein [Paenibacillus]AWP28761.1 hypothetical protein B9D94_19965 [Paenibacillus sp. Cedars]EFU41633.1 hypothetical protein PVOR_11845 [Paenibacillus vortex V453]KZS47801.1 hypothetical protein AWU65_18690 [Paenibacillus glucanolyticus]
MKLKKMLTVLLISTSVFSFSQAAFADNATTSEVAPFVIGVGDSRELAIDLLQQQNNFNLFLQSGEDEDWFKWTNNTGQDRFVFGAVWPRGYADNILELGAIVKYNETRETNLITGGLTNKGNTGYPSFFQNLYVPEGATLFLRVKAHEFVNTESYEFSFTYYSAIP